MSEAENAVLVLDFEKGRLDPDAAPVAGAHLAACAECREILEVYRLFATQPAAFEEVAAHPSSDELVRLALGTGSPAEDAALQPHLDRCIACRATLDTIADADREASGALSSSVPHRPGNRRWLMVAASILAAGLLGLFLGRLTDSGGLPEVEQPLVASSAVERVGFALPLLQGTVRDRARPPVVPVSPSQRSVPLAVAVAIPAEYPDDVLWEMRIENEDGESTFELRQSAGEFRKWSGDSGAFLVVVPRASLPDGAFTLYMNHATAREDWFQSPFVVRTGP